MLHLLTERVRDGEQKLCRVDEELLFVLTEKIIVFLSEMKSLLASPASFGPLCEMLSDEPKPLRLFQL